MLYSLKMDPLKCKRDTNNVDLKSFKQVGLNGNLNIHDKGYNYEFRFYVIDSD